MGRLLEMSIQLAIGLVILGIVVLNMVFLFEVWDNTSDKLKCTGIIACWLYLAGVGAILIMQGMDHIPQMLELVWASSSVKKEL